MLNIPYQPLTLAIDGESSIHDIINDAGRLLFDCGRPGSTVADMMVRAREAACAGETMQALTVLSEYGLRFSSRNRILLIV